MHRTTSLKKKLLICIPLPLSPLSSLYPLPPLAIKINYMSLVPRLSHSCTPFHHLLCRPQRSVSTATSRCALLTPLTPPYSRSSAPPPCFQCHWAKFGLNAVITAIFATAAYSKRTTSQSLYFPKLLPAISVLF